jgi:pimeloyl-ACP methyl ester carboxylesterase
MHHTLRSPARLAGALALLLGAAFPRATQGQAGQDDGHRGRDDGRDRRPIVIQREGNFFVGGTRSASGQLVGQMYVEYEIPADARRRYPVVLVHGGGQIGAGWWQTPDGREGWAQYFLRRGFAVYVVDQPARGRSPYDSSLGPLAYPANAERARQLWAAPERYNLWPAARLHTQWPGTANDGDPAFEQFLASQSDALATGELQERLTADGLVALLDRIGPAILIPHSQPGAPAWLVADRRPRLVKALVQLEPGGPPVARDAPAGPFASGPTFAWGLTRLPITSSPAASSPAQLSFVAQPQEPGVATCWVQTEPARQLTNVQRVPVLLLTSASGYNTAWDPCTSRFLTQAGVEHTWLKLPDIGIEGNGHFMFVEKNSDQVAGVVLDWIRDHVDLGRGGRH